MHIFTYVRCFSESRSSEDEADGNDVGPFARSVWNPKPCYYRNPVITDLFQQLERIKASNKIASLFQVQLKADTKEKSKCKDKTFLTYAEAKTSAFLLIRTCSRLFLLPTHSFALTAANSGGCTFIRGVGVHKTKSCKVFVSRVSRRLVERVAEQQI